MEHENNIQQAEEVVVRLLARREHSVRELHQKLKQRGFDHHTIDLVLKKAQEHGWQSDERFAHVWIRTCIARGDGLRKIVAQAPHKGVSAELIEQVLQREKPDWNEACYQRLIRKFGEMPAVDKKQRDKIMRHLLQRGFSFEAINHALERQATAFAD